MTKRRRDCGWLAETDLELLERVDRIIDSSSCALEIEETADRLRDISNNSSERKEKRSAKRLSQTLDDFADRIQELEESGIGFPPSDLSNGTRRWGHQSKVGSDISSPTPFDTSRFSRASGGMTGS